MYFALATGVGKTRLMGAFICNLYLVATRENFDADYYTEKQLERLKLEDGVRIHESAKVADPHPQPWIHE